MRAYHFLREDMRSSNGAEVPWVVGETRTVPGILALCRRGYHSCPTWGDCRDYLYGPIACEVDVSEPVERDKHKQVSRTRKLVAARNVLPELRLWALECAERAARHSPAARALHAVTRRRLDGAATRGELDIARSADAYAAAAAFTADAYDAYADAYDAERTWQNTRLGELMDAAFARGQIEAEK